jgi:hypothetical protein
MWYSFFLTGIAVLALSTTAARAELFTGSFTGTTSDGMIYAGPSGANYFGISVAPNQSRSLAGLSVSGTISYDTATTFPSWEEGHLVNPATGENYLTGYYPSLPFTITETINGVSLAVTGTTYSGLAIAQLDGINQGSGGWGDASRKTDSRESSSSSVYHVDSIEENMSDFKSRAGRAPEYSVRSPP